MHYIVTVVLPPNPEHKVLHAEQPVFFGSELELVAKASPSLETALTEALDPYNENEHGEPTTYSWTDPNTGETLTEEGESNPNGKWDWWVLGGRWAEKYQDYQGMLLANFVRALERKPSLRSWSLLTPNEGIGTWTDQWDWSIERGPEDLNPFSDEFAQRWHVQYLELLRKVPGDGVVYFVDYHS